MTKIMKINIVSKVNILVSILFYKYQLKFCGLSWDELFEKSINYNGMVFIKLIKLLYKILSLTMDNLKFFMVWMCIQSTISYFSAH